MYFLKNKGSSLFFEFFVGIYRYAFSPWLHFLCGPGFGCRFLPNCSAYAEEAVHIHGLRYGAWLSICRVFRCNPFTQAGYDPVPRVIANPIHHQCSSRKANHGP